MTVNKIIVSPLHFPLDGGRLNYNLQVVTSTDGGKTFYYCGNGAYAKDKDDVKAKLIQLANKYHVSKVERRAVGIG